MHVSNNKSIISFLSVYCSPSKSKVKFLMKLNDSMQTLSHVIMDHIIVRGDYNIYILDVNQYSSNLINILLSNNLFPFIYKPTSAVTYNASIIDNIFANLPVLLHSGLIV